MPNFRTDVQITTNGTKTCIKAPFNRHFQDEIKKTFRARFDRDLGNVWVVDARDEQRLRELCTEYFGSDGSDGSDGNLPPVTVRIPVPGGDDSQRWTASTFSGAGRILLERRERDADVRLAEGVVVISGGFAGSGGSVRYPQINAKSGTVIEVRDLPPGAAAFIREQHPGVETIAVAVSVVDEMGLLIERQNLLSRLLNVERQLVASGAITGTTITEEDLDSAIARIGRDSA
jgi:hypothetical protein